MFYIALAQDLKNYLGYGIGEIILGTSKENFYSSFDYWQVSDYEQQWKNAITRLINGADSSALITSLPPDSSDDMIEWRPMWRIDETIYTHDQMFIRSELESVFDPSDPYSHVGPRGTEAENEDRVSEWTVSLKDLADFLIDSSKAKNVT